MDSGEIIINILASAIAVEYMGHGLEKKYTGWRHWLLFVGACAVYFLLVTTFNFFSVFEGVLCIFYGAALTLYGVLGLKGSLYDKVFLSLMWVINVLFGTFIVWGFLCAFSGKNITEILFHTDKKTVFFASLAAGAVKFFIGRIILRLYHRREDTARKEDWLLAIVLFLILCLSLNMVRLEFFLTVKYNRYAWLTCLLMVWFVGILLLERLSQKLEVYRRQKMELEFQRKMTREINHWRHDMNGKLETMYHLQQNKQYDELERVLKEICKEYEKLPELAQTTCCSGLNAVLKKALSLCQNNGIRFSYAVLGKPDIIDNLDMESLMWNLFSNGIEACQQVEGARNLNVILCAKDGGLHIHLENTISDSVLKNNPRLLSSKADKLSHGFGMQTIYAILDKYHGEYLCKEENGLFIQELYLQRIM